MSDYGPYGRVALAAAQSLSANRAMPPLKAWELAAEQIFPDKPESRKKNCPRTTFLALCGVGRVAGVPAGSYCQASENWEHAISALQILDREPAHNPASLWKQVTDNSGKTHNQQMHVVLALSRAGLLQDVEAAKAKS
jgi:hypothetical protein